MICLNFSLRFLPLRNPNRKVVHFFLVIRKSWLTSEEGCGPIISIVESHLSWEWN